MGVEKFAERLKFEWLQTRSAGQVRAGGQQGDRGPSAGLVELAEAGQQQTRRREELGGGRTGKGIGVEFLSERTVGVGGHAVWGKGGARQTPSWALDEARSGSELSNRSEVKSVGDGRAALEPRLRRLNLLPLGAHAAVRLVESYGHMQATASIGLLVLCGPRRRRRRRAASRIAGAWIRPSISVHPACASKQRAGGGQQAARARGDARRGEAGEGWLAWAGRA